MSKPLTKSPPPIKPSRLRQVALATTSLTPVGPNGTSIDLSFALAADAWGLSFR
ncbi:hypothetical protein [Brevundimonas sp.]|uniref:hypothetical protein n=1 Tax=Brevundimonas sp. TaxID=1871086 RepID=UPI002898E5D5|nr:hypothetical protein [Brevundimonas sp.]